MAKAEGIAYANAAAARLAFGATIGTIDVGARCEADVTGVGLTHLGQALVLSANLIRTTAQEAGRGTACGGARGFAGIFGDAHAQLTFFFVCAASGLFAFEGFA